MLYVYLPVNTKEIHSITLKICDQDGNPNNFRGKRITIRLHYNQYTKNDYLFICTL